MTCCIFGCDRTAIWDGICEQCWVECLINDLEHEE